MSSDLQVCFTCLNSSANALTNLITLDEDHISFLDKLQEFTMINLIHNERMEICQECVTKLKLCYSFKEIVLQSQETWQKYLEEAIARPASDEKLIISEEFYIKEQSQLCNYSEGESNEETAATQHINEYDNKESINFDDLNCNKCNVTFETSSNLASHVCNEQLNEYSDARKIENILYCEKCDNTFEDSYKLENHSCNTPKQSSKRGRPATNKDQSFKCDMCDLTFKKKWLLHKHQDRKHTERKRFVCTFCNKAFKESYHLREHITSHTGERKFSCPICNKSFQRISSQRRHLRSHNAEYGNKTKKTPFLCTICGKTFPYSNGAQRHMRTHSGDRNFSCTLCNKRFSQSTHLHVHMRVHTGEKPFRCNTCGDSFSLKVALKKHMNVHVMNYVPHVPKSESNILDDVINSTVLLVQHNMSDVIE